MQTTRRLELDITYACNMGCDNCNRFCQLVPGDRETQATLAQVHDLIRQSVDMDYPWDQWAIVGGEPTMHPEFQAIVNAVAEYRTRHRPALKIVLASNGRSKASRMLLRWTRTLHSGVRILNSRKAGARQPTFRAVCMAPVDIAPRENYPGCTISQSCGMGWNYRGFYPCAVAAAIDRVLGPSSPIRSLEDVTLDRLAVQRRALCRLCGFALDRPPIARDRGNVLSPTWEAAMAARRPGPAPRVWSYWVGPRPPWIELCLETLRRNIPGIEILDAETWERLYMETGGDPGLWAIVEPLRPNLHSDFIRAWLLHTIGGIWVDADCIMFKDIRPIWSNVQRGAECVTCNMPNLRAMDFRFSAVLAADKTSRIMDRYWRVMVRRLRDPRPVKRNESGPSMLAFAARRFADAVHLVPHTMLHPFWSGKRTSVPADADPGLSPPGAYCAMLTCDALGQQREYTREQLLEGNGCASVLFRRALGVAR